MYSRQKVVDLANSWVGRNEKDGSFKKIIDIYNNSKYSSAYKMKYTDSWCACTWSAIAISLGYDAIMPIDVSCGRLIEKAKKMGIWVEDDTYIPSVGDAVLYDWDDKGTGDCTGWPEHIGTVTAVNKEQKYFVVTEGNYSDAVKKRTVGFNARFIRGFITPKYDKEEATSNVSAPNGDKLKLVALEVIKGEWGDGESRKKNLKSAGFDPAEIQNEVNKILNGGAYKPVSETQDQTQKTNSKVSATTFAASKDLAKFSKKFKTTANVYMRNGAGKSYSALALIPNNTEVICYGYYTNVNSVPWLLVEVKLDFKLFTGFVCSTYLK